MATTQVRRPGARKPQAAQDAERKAETGSGWYSRLARGGLVAKGVSFGIVGVLAIKLALGDGGETTDRQGALQSLAQHSLGKVLLALLATGFAAYAAWRLVQAFAEHEDDEDEAKAKAKTWGKRAGYVGRGVVYAGLTFSAVRILLGSGGQSQDQKARQTTATVLDLPAGRWLAAIAGIVVVGVGLWNLYRGIARKFEDKWRTGRMSPTERTWGGRAGVAGHVARFVVFTLIGVFVVKAAVTYDPSEAIGLDGSLEKLAGAAYGPYLLGLTAAGLVCYGIYCLVDARYRDVSTGAGGGRDRGRPAARERRAQP